MLAGVCDEYFDVSISADISIAGGGVDKSACVSISSMSSNTLSSRRTPACSAANFTTVSRICARVRFDAPVNSCPACDMRMKRLSGCCTTIR